QRAERDRLQLGRGGGQRLLAEGPRRTQVGGAHQSSVTDPPRPASASRTASASSGESSCSPRPAWICLQYMRAVSRWAIVEITTPLRRASSRAIVVDWWPDSP